MINMININVINMIFFTELTLINIRSFSLSLDSSSLQFGVPQKNLLLKKSALANGIYKSNTFYS